MQIPFFLLWISLGFFLQIEFIFLKMSELEELKYFFAKVSYVVDTILAIIFFPIYLFIDKVAESDKKKADFYWDIWIGFLKIFLWLPVYYPLSLLIRIEIRVRGEE